ncbi:MAG: hypothetical protein ACYC6L_09265 [Anaerolineae bacterium]
MQLANYRQAPFNATLMGVLRAAADYYGLKLSTPALYGGSGHAFLMNIHQELCPSGPYVWKREPFYQTLRNVGLDVHNLGFFWNESPAADRSALEAKLRAALDAGTPGMFDNMEFQSIYGYDDTGLLCGMPWGPMDVTPGRLTWGNWAEMNNEIHASFVTIHACAPADPADQLRGGLRYALDLYAHPEQHSGGAYAAGAGAWDNWLGAIRADKVNPHGNWWNAMVWSECRGQAAEWFAELAGAYPAQAEVFSVLADDYRKLSEALMRVGGKETPNSERLVLLEDAKARESGCIAQIGELLKVLG